MEWGTGNKHNYTKHGQNVQHVALGRMNAQIFSIFFPPCFLFETGRMETLTFPFVHMYVSFLLCWFLNWSCAFNQNHDTYQGSGCPVAHNKKPTLFDQQLSYCCLTVWVSGFLFRSHYPSIYVRTWGFLKKNIVMKWRAHWPPCLLIWLKSTP